MSFDNSHSTIHNDVVLPIANNNEATATAGMYVCVTNN